MSKLLILLLIPFALLGCDAKPADSVTHAGANSGGPTVHVMTVTHDGHKIIVASSRRSDGGMSMIHHPSCECLKSR